MVPTQMTADLHQIHNSSLEALQPLPEAHSNPLSTPYTDCFDWHKIAEELPLEEGRPLYAVVFRSVRKSSADTQELYAADEAAHEEARLAGGLLKYWHGTLNERRECLATCIWASRDAARAALGRPAHVKAMKLAAVMYDTYTLERYWIHRFDHKLEVPFTGLTFCRELAFEQID